MRFSGMRFTAGLCTALTLATAVSSVQAQDYSQYSDAALERELAEKADVDMYQMAPMRDGVRLATNVYRPKGAKGPLPTILIKTPYNELAYKPRAARDALNAIKHGYALVLQNERGRFHSEGEWEILGKPQTDGYDTLTWIAKQTWSNGKVGTLGCSSSAEWQLALAAQNHPAHAAMIPMASGAGIGKVGEFEEQGNWYTGGVPRTLFFIWLYGVDNPLRPQLPKNLDAKTIARLAKYDDLAPKKPDVNWTSQVRKLPVANLLQDLGEPKGTFEELISRNGPADPAWRKGGLYHDDKGWGVPALWFNSWYDVSIGPNMALFNHARTANSDKEASANQYAVVTPGTHCTFNAKTLQAPYTSGDRSMGTVDFDADKEVYAFFDRWVKGDKAAFPASTPPVRYYAMGENAWKQSAQWPPESAKPMRLYLRSGGKANSAAGDGRLLTAAPAAGEQPDRYAYDPANPVQTIGGGDCCNGGLVTAGAFDQRVIEARDDVLVYTSDPLTAPLDVSGFVRAVLKVSSDAKDTDFAVKLVDVAPDGTAYILGDTILRARYRDGFDKPRMLTAGEVATLKPTPITTSNTFLPGHRIRVEVTSSNFPKFTRNLNTGGDNEKDTAFVTARNAVHHAAGEESYIELPVVEK
ncbi:putative acylase [Caulobacter sp. RHG1]|nr:putative acylase [Caulobacter sp. RHG1]